MKDSGLKMKLFIWLISLPMLGGINFKLEISFENTILTNYAHRKFFSLFSYSHLLKWKWRDTWGQQTPPLLYSSLLGFVPPPLFSHFLSLYPTLGSPSFLTTSVMVYIFILHFWAFSMMSGRVFFGYDLRQDDGIFMFYKLLCEKWEFECL